MNQDEGVVMGTVWGDWRGPAGLPDAGCVRWEPVHQGAAGTLHTLKCYGKKTLLSVSVFLVVQQTFSVNCDDTWRTEFATLRNLYCAQASLTPKLQFVWNWTQTRYTSLTLARLKEVCFGMLWLLRHKHGCATWTWRVIMCIVPPCIIDKPWNVRRPPMSKTTQNEP